MSSRFTVKRIFDLLLLLIAAPLIVPLTAAVAILVRRRLGSPVLFRQLRPGKDGQLFEMIKFRSMVDKLGADGQPLPDSERLPPFGARLRSTSLDELPALWNVFKGDMSLVGPRPLLPDYLPLYSAEQARRHEVLPGITGWAQINGRNSISWNSKFELDVWYVDNRSLWLDIRVIAQTLLKVIRKDGISASGEVTMPKFSGQQVESKSTD